MSASMDDVYAALRAADAAGNTADAQALANYIGSQGAPSAAPDTAAQSQAPPAPTAPIGSFLQNAYHGVPMFFNKLSTGLAQRYAQAFEPNISAPLEQMAAKERAYYAPLQSTWGGKAGEALGGLPFALAPGANTLAGSAVLGGLLGGAQPTVGNESPLANTALGAGLGLLGQGVGSKVGKWASARAPEPFLGWAPDTAAQTATQATGITAPKLTQQAARQAQQRFSQIFGAGRDPNVDVPIGQNSLNALANLDQGLTDQSRRAFYANGEVNELVSHLGGDRTAAQLGSLSNKLNAASNAELTSRGGDRQLGLALQGAKEHVEDLIQGSIQDPALASAYGTARGQFRDFKNMTASPSIWNSAKGDVNMTALGKRLQKVDPKGYAQGLNQSPLYNAARWGQQTGEGGGPPHFTMTNFGVPPALYWLRNNLASRALGGATSRAVAPVSLLLPPAARGLLAPATISATGGLAQ